VAVALIAVFFLQVQPEVTPLAMADPEAEMFANVDPQDYDIVSDLNDLFSSDESNSLDEGIFR
jgi:hypothetical protein